MDTSHLFRLLLKFLGAPIPEDLTISGHQFTLEGIHWVWAALFAAAAFVVLFITYRTQPYLRRSRANALLVLRAIFFGVLLLLLVRPVLLVLTEAYVRSTLVVLLDTSSSMTVKDRRIDPADLARAAIAMGEIPPDGGLKAPLSAANAAKYSGLSREEIVRGLFANGRLNLLNQITQKCDLELYTVGREATDAGKAIHSAPSAPNQPSPPLLDGVKFDKPNTALGDALRMVLEQKRGQGLAGVLLITDGASNSGIAPPDAAALAASDGVPVFAYGVGVTTPRDISITGIDAPDTIFFKDSAEVKVRLRGLNMKGRKAPLSLKLGDKEIGVVQVAFDSADEQSVTIPLTADIKGSFDLTATIPVQDDEAAKENNVASRRVQVVDRRLGVLLVETKARWEFRYLSSLLARDRRIRMKCVLLDADESLGSEGEESIYLPSLPAEKTKLLEYDVVLLGDVDIGRLPAGFIEGITDLVSKNSGGLVLLAGPDYCPATLKGSPIEPLCPVDLSGFTTLTEAPWDENTDPTPAPKMQLLPVAAGIDSSLLQLTDKQPEGTKFWETLPGINWVAPAGDAKPTAEVYLRASPAGTPVLVIQNYGLGQVAYVGTDEFYKLRRGVGEAHHTRLWDQLLLKLGARRMEADAGLVQLTPDKRAYTPGEKVSISGRLFNTGFVARTDAAVEAIVEFQPEDATGRPSGEKKKLSTVLNLKAGEPGVYRGDFSPEENGTFTLLVPMPGAEPLKAFDIHVSEPRLEQANVAMDEKVLQRMAELSGGHFLREEDLTQLPKWLKPRTEQIATPLRIDIVHHWIWFALAVVTATAEWSLRKLSQLK